MLTFYRELNKDKEFSLMHCFGKLQNCEKGKKLRVSLKKGGLGDVVDVDASEGRPVRNKKVKAAVAAAANSERMNASIEKVIAEVSKNSNKKRAANDAKWVTFMEKTDKKLVLEKSKLVVKKRREDFMIPGHLVNLSMAT